ncbi:MAG TPA: DEAD/DEAH box helicase [Candidatus Thermoplasmatota archaeon]|nr:DEAD/DEAH box helicase [Candidatus Thermoplasmatota archaeon]
MATFADLGVSSRVLDALLALHFKAPTPIQEGAIPPLLAGRDVLGQAATGTGKTAAYGIPIAERTKRGTLSALVLVPTRELATQVAEELNAIGANSGLLAVPVYGGVGYGRQAEALQSGEATCIVATPGRLLDLLQQGLIPRLSMETVVLDEADRLLDMGFQQDIARILEALPRDRQTVLMSATFPPPVKDLARRFLRDPVRVRLDEEAPEIVHRYVQVEEKEKAAAVARFVEAEDPFDVLVFVNTRDRVDTVYRALRKAGLDAAPFHGGLTQQKRETALEKFREGDIRILVATDLAARGIDIVGLAAVVNYDLPEGAEAYVHRVGRTGRAGRKGFALSLVARGEVEAFFAIAAGAGAGVELYRPRQ